MATGGTTSVKTKRIRSFTTVLASAACEWFLIFLLLINAVVSYLLTKFASYCDLQAPCVLCSRLDRVISGEKLGNYQNILCSKHKSEISSLVSCHIHDKVSDGHGMCDDCLLSFIPKDKHHLKTHRLLVGKLGLDLGGCGFPNSVLSRDNFNGPVGSKICTCCGKLWNSGQNAQKSLLLKSSGTPDFKLDFPLPDVSRQSCPNHQDNLKKISDKSSALTKKSLSSLSFGEYTDLNLASDSESEFAFSDDDDVGSLIRGNIEARNSHVSQFTSVFPLEISDSNPVKPNSNSLENEPLILYPCVEPNISKYHKVNFTGSVAVNDYGLGEINWQQVCQKSSNSELPELITLNEASPSPDGVAIPNGEHEEIKNTCLSQNTIPAALPEVMTSDTRTLVGVSPKKSADDTPPSGIECLSEKNEEGLEKITTRAETSIETAQHGNDSALSNPRHDNSSDMKEVSVTNKESEVTDSVKEHPTPDEVTRVNKELKLSPSHNYSPRGINISSFVPVSSPEIETNTSSFIGTQELQKSASVESGLESLEGSSVSEIEGESIVDRLKRQVEHDKKCMSALYKELEAERNASAIAANESMAMITRLQEEKAVLHMEALQYLRMMDEQAEYDGDALDKANDLLAEKEKEIQDLEAELEFYRLYVDDEAMGQNMLKKMSDSKGENVSVQSFSVPPINVSSNSNIAEASEVCDESVVDETSFEFEDERLYISNCLLSLEKKLREISYNGISSDMHNGRPEIFEESKYDQQGSSNGEGPELDSQTDNNDLSKTKDFSTPNGSLTDQAGSVASENDNCSPSNKEKNHSASVGQKNSIQRNDVDLVALENEISDLHERLEALEADHDLLEHILRSLQHENDGLQFVREIAHQLQELRTIRTTLRW
ncbi:putative myosin-binding protein 4 isoform X1 [Senna tora]|uniref:Putative myosin-binding protein 4 isoform X1 n=1 Tax=Senna tora TaxID=362788 RepID=A0A834SHR7_9FABA|nr:putative myosin-binding protein 4 isoform X1 [Senna tora]